MPSCTEYDPSDDDLEYYFGSHGGGPVGTWDSDTGTFELVEDFFQALVEVPGGSGENLTIRVQIAYEGEVTQADLNETNLEVWASDGAGGKGDFAGEMATNTFEDPEGSGVWVQEGTFTSATPGVQPWFADEGNIIGVLNGGTFTITGIIIDVIRHDGDAPTSGPGRDICGGGSLPNPILIDPNVMLVYETGETVGDFGASLLNEPPAGATITITVDPNAGGPSEDITLIGGSGVNGSITMTFTDTTATDANSNDLLIGSCVDWNPATRTSCWNCPQPVVFKAIDDEIAEPPNLQEPQNILVSSSWPAHPTDANFVGEKGVTVNVMDNDQANILFRVTPSRGGARLPVTGPVQLWEEFVLVTGLPKEKWRKIGFQLQVQPSGGPVKLNAVVEGEIEGDNLPTTDPCLPYEGPVDPNGFTFTSTTSSNGLGTGCPDHDLANKTTCWNVDQDVKIWGTDDAVLQVEAFAEGDQNYQAVLVVWVVDDGGDERFTDMERTVDIDIEDNECGAYGLSYLDISNPNALTDPNYLDEEGNPLPDCYVDIYDIIEFATRWLKCSDPQDPACESYL